MTLVKEASGPNALESCHSSASMVIQSSHHGENHGFLGLALLDAGRQHQKQISNFSLKEEMGEISFQITKLA